MKPRILCFVLTVIINSSASSQNLFFPVSGGKILHTTSTVRSEPGNGILITATHDSIAVSMENSVVESVFLVDGVYTIVLKGQYDVIYSSFRRTFVRKGEAVTIGEPIGVLAKANDETLLELNIKRSGKTVRPNELSQLLIEPHIK